MASAFGTLAHEGVHCQPFVIEKVVDGAGSTIMEQDAGPCRRALRGGIASRVVWMLEQVIQRGTGTAASLGSRPAFGKTGTTDDYSDAWFVGCTVQLCAATWVGHQRAPIPMPDVHGTAVFGGTFPAEIWRDFMLVAMRGRPRIAFPEPPPIPGAVLAPEPAPVELDGGESEGDGEGTGEEGQGEGHGEEGNGKGNGNEGNQGRGQGDGG